MRESQLGGLAKLYLPLLFAAIVLISTVIRHLTVSIPASSWREMAVLDGVVIVMLAPLLYHCLRTMGVTQGLLFFPDASTLGVALLCGLMGLCTNLWMDPVIVNFHLD